MFRIKNLILILSVTLFCLAISAPTASFAQSVGLVEELEEFHPEKGNVSIDQDTLVAQLLNEYYVKNASKPGMQGFRIRIFFDLGQQSRTSSLDVMDEFMENFSGIAVYRTYDSPYYKVSIGDFRTRDEALKLHKKILKEYPKAFIVPEWINFPRLD
ncbi:MAG: SPOR domain-containing protein [Bacteroidales bacterium]